jgi:large subunit ribosomal protein L21
MFAIVEAGGRQEKVEPGVLVRSTNWLPSPAPKITFDKVLLVETDGGDVMTGTPYVKGVTVTGVVEAQTRARRSSCSR